MNRAKTNDLDQRRDRLCEVYRSPHFIRDATAIAEQLASHLTQAAARQRTVWPAVDPDALLQRWPDPEQGPQVELPSLIADIIADSTCQHHPGFVGQQLSVPPPLLGAVAMVSAILNNSAAIFEGAPVAIALEQRIVSWMARKAGLGDSAGGVLTSGGTLGALTALLAMRQSRVAGDPWGNGMTGSERHAVFVSAQAHYCNRRACAVLGLGEQAVVPVATDPFFRMDPDSLHICYQQARRDGRRPLAVIGNAGSTATGSHDDLQALATFCEERRLWFHVDAAHGGSALLSPKYAPQLRGIERADSVVWDAHKMMLVPSLCTAVLVRDARHLDAAFRQEASYLLSDVPGPWHEPASRNFETTKPTMVFPLYAALRTLGPEFLADCVEYAYDLARAFADEIERREPFELLTRPECNIVCFRRRTSADQSDALQLALRDTVNRNGRFFIMRTRLRGEVWLRVVLMNPATRMADLESLLDELLRAGDVESPAGPHCRPAT